MSEPSHFLQQHAPELTSLPEGATSLIRKLYTDMLSLLRDMDHFQGNLVPASAVQSITQMLEDPAHGNLVHRYLQMAAVETYMQTWPPKNSSVGGLILGFLADHTPASTTLPSTIGKAVLDMITTSPHLSISDEDYFMTAANKLSSKGMIAPMQLVMAYLGRLDTSEDDCGKSIAHILPQLRDMSQRHPHLAHLIREELKVRLKPLGFDMDAFRDATVVARSFSHAADQSSAPAAVALRAEKLSIHAHAQLCMIFAGEPPLPIAVNVSAGFKKYLLSEAFSGEDASTRGQSIDALGKIACVMPELLTQQDIESIMQATEQTLRNTVNMTDTGSSNLLLEHFGFWHNALPNFHDPQWADKLHTMLSQSDMCAQMLIAESTDQTLILIEGRRLLEQTQKLTGKAAPDLFSDAARAQVEGVRRIDAHTRLYGLNFPNS